MEKILISACLLGDLVKYNGGHNLIASTRLARWQAENRLIPCCPEMLGGMPVPRNPAEIRNGDGADVLKGTASVVDNRGVDISAQFIAGARSALDLIRQHDIKIAILKERSPSCGSHHIYNGRFQGQTREGKGVTATLLSQYGIKVFNETELAEAEQALLALS